MASYFQMGHDSENLVGESDLDEFTGIILSPVNREPLELQVDIRRFRDLSSNEYEIVLDSQLYFPRSNRGKLVDHIYFPNDLDSTNELSSPEWWEKVAIEVAKYAVHLGVNVVTSPILLPKTWTDDYYTLCADTARVLLEELSEKRVLSWLTLIVNLNQMAASDAALRISSIVSEANPDGYYLVIDSDISPRRELVGENELAGILHLIRLLESTGKPVTVSHCSSDSILFKAVGASNCATGKFFNLRRSSKSRYEEPSKGGKVIAYWFEESLLAFLRNADVARLDKRGFDDLIGVGNSTNVWSDKIITQWETDPAKAWLALSWRHYLSWFGKTESEFNGDDALEKTETMLVNAEESWRKLKGILLDEPENDGSWVRNWRQVLDEYKIRIAN